MESKQPSDDHVDQSAELEHLIHMANQIADNNFHQGEKEIAIANTVKHIKNFWALSMKKQIIQYQHNDGKLLNEIVYKAVIELNETYQMTF
ncbi:MAG: formate dehydrogenase subunit delta [Enterobacterales bacterium]|jgi:formate dehydrogenase subunit delta